MISFDCAETLGAAYNYEYLGGGNFVYKVSRTFDIRGSLESVSGFSGIWNQIPNYKPCAEYEEIVLNGCGLGSGRIANISFAGSNDVTNKDYTATIELQHPENVINYQGVFTGFDLSAVESDFVKSFDETFSYSKESKDNYNFQRTLNLELHSGFTSQTPREAAELIANNVFNNEVTYSLIDFSFPGFYTSSGNRKFSETCDDLNYKYSFTEDFSYDSSSQYIWDYTNSLSLNDRGVVEVTEQGSVVGNTDSKLQSALDGFSNVGTGVSTRVDNLFAAYSGQGLLVNTCPSSFELVTRTLDTDECAGIINYSYNFSNDQLYSGDTCVHSYSYSTTKQENGVISLSKKGEIRGRGDDKTIRFNNALGCWAVASGNIEPSILDLYNNKYVQECKNKTPQVTNRSINFSEYNGTVNYDYSYNDDYEIANSGDFKQIKTERQMSLPVPLTNNFNLVNYKEIAQRTTHGTVGNLTNKVSMVGENDTALSEYINTAQQYLYDIPDDVYGPFLSEFEYTFAPNTNAFEMSAGVTFIRAKAYEDTNAQAH